MGVGSWVVELVWCRWMGVGGWMVGWWVVDGWCRWVGVGGWGLVGGWWWLGGSGWVPTYTS